MSAPLPDSGIDAHDAPPPYDAVSSPGAPADLPPEKAPLPDNVEDEAESAFGLEPPPPFTVTPGTLFLAPNSVLIRSTASPVGRPLYQLSKPLNGHVMSVIMMNVPEHRDLHDDGTMNGIAEEDKLYRIYEHRDLANMNSVEVTVSAQKPNQFHGVRLKKTSSFGLAGTKEFFEATCGDELNKKVLYQARKNKGIFEWRDGTNRLVAIDTPAIDRKSQEESLDILVALDKKHLDLLVALWMACIWHDTQAEGKKEDKQVAKKLKYGQRQLDKEEGKPHGPLHEMKEALGIGYGVKGPSSGGLYPGGMPGTNQNGRINWGDRRFEGPRKLKD